MKAVVFARFRRRIIDGGDVRWHIADEVLKRNATKSDYVVLPLLAGAISRCALSIEAVQVRAGQYRELWPRYQEAAHQLLSLCDEGKDEAWVRRPELYGDLYRIVTFTWPSVAHWVSPAWVFALTGSKVTMSKAERLEDVLRWLRTAKEVSLVECGLLACFAFTLCEERPGDFALFRLAMRPLRVEIARRLREKGLIGWPQIVRAVRAEWNVAFLQKVMFAYVAATENIVNALAQRSEKAIDQLAMRAALLEEALSEERRAAKDASDRRSEVTALRSRLHAIQSALREQEEKTHRLEREALVVAERHAGADAHAEALELALTEAKARGRELEVELAKLRRERQRELEDHAVERALVPDAPELPADLFAGRRVMLFTGHAVASTREAMRQSFFEFGAAQVDCYWADRTRGPESFPADAIVVIDVTFMSHSTSEAIIGRAERSGAWCMVCRRGTALIAREAAARFLARGSSK